MPDSSACDEEARDKAGQGMPLRAPCKKGGENRGKQKLGTWKSYILEGGKR